MAEFRCTRCGSWLGPGDCLNCGSQEERMFKKIMDAPSEHKDASCFQIFYSDLRPTAQAHLLKYANLESPEEANWNTLPLVEIVCDREGLVDEPAPDTA